MIKNAITALLFILAVLLFCPSLPFAEVKEIIAEGTYNMGDGETPSVAETRALLNAKRTAMEQAGTYIQSYSKVKNFQLTHDEIQVLASGVVEVTILEKKRTVVGDGFNFWVKIKARIPTDKIEEMARNVKDKSEVEDYRRLLESYNKLEKDIELLKEEFKASRSEKERKEIEAKIATEEKLFQSKTFYEKGKMQFLSRKYDDAIESLNAAIGLDPNSADAYSSRGAVYLRKNQLDRAVDDINKALSINSNSAKAYNNRAGIYVRKREYDRALEDANKAISIDPNLPQPYSMRGAVFLGKREYDKALEEINKAIAIDPNLAQAYSSRGLVYGFKNAPDKALEDFSRAITLDPNAAEAYAGRGMVYFYRNQLDAALEDFNKALLIDPNLRPFYYTRGLIHQKLGNLPQAITDMKTAARLEVTAAQQWLSGRGEKW